MRLTYCLFHVLRPTKICDLRFSVSWMLADRVFGLRSWTIVDRVSGRQLVVSRLSWADSDRETSGRDHFWNRQLRWSALSNERTQWSGAGQRTPRCRNDPSWTRRRQPSTTPSLANRVPPPWSTRGRTGRRQPFHYAVVAAREPSPWTLQGRADDEAKSTTALTPESINRRK